MNFQIALTFFPLFFFLQVDKTTMNELELFRLLKEYALALDIETTRLVKMRRCEDAT